MKKSEIKLGKKYVDKVHGIEGTATAYCSYVTGCDQVRLEFYQKDKAEITCFWFDITQIKNIKIAKKNRKRGGPQSNPASRSQR